MNKVIDTKIYSNDKNDKCEKSYMGINLMEDRQPYIS